jgi:hypothetical protein
MAAQCCSTQLTLQQSVFEPHESPACEHVVGFAAQVPLEAQSPEQQPPPSTKAEQDWP